MSITAFAVKLKLAGATMDSGFGVGGFLLGFIGSLRWCCGLRLRCCEPKFVHQRQLFRSLTKLGFPVESAFGVLVSERGRVIGKPSGLRVGFFGWIDVFVPIPEPLMRPIDDWSEARWKKIGQQRCFVEPRSENAIEHDTLQV